MASLNWIGKEAIVRHHRQVPYHLLRSDSALSRGDPDGGNPLARRAILPVFGNSIENRNHLG